MDAISWSTVFIASLLGAIFDIRQRRLPNLLTLPIFVWGLFWNGYQGGGQGVGSACGAAMLVALPFVFLFLVGAGGAGDAKMMGALGACLRAPHAYYLLAAVALSGAVLGVAYGLRRGKLSALRDNLSRMTVWLPWLMLGPGKLRDRADLWPAKQAMTRMPYGVAIFIGCCLAMGGVWRWRL